MKKLFIETYEFTSRVTAFLTDEDYTVLQTLLMTQPDLGKVMPGCGGLRKLRVADPRRGKGKRGGIRIVYLHVPEADLIFFMKIYDKGSQEDLDAHEKKILKKAAEEFRKEALR